MSELDLFFLAFSSLQRRQGEHAPGPLWLAKPLILIDVHEHAFYIDYQNRQAEYVEKFMKFLDREQANFIRRA